MKKLLLASTAVIAVTGAAFAADLPSRAAPPVFVPPPAFVWTGFYLGGYAGAHFGGTDTLTNVVGNGFDLKATGFVAGGLAGFNWQFNQIVLGGEGEVGYADYDRSITVGPELVSNKANIDGRIRGRIGYAIGSFGFGNAMIFAAGGASFLENQITVLGPPTGFTSATRDRLGFNVGAGVEVAVTPNWIVRAEYIYDDYGKKLYTFPGAGFGGTVPVKITDNTVRAAVEYKFDWAAPAVVAKY